jgi:hypothetical protein
MHLKQRKQTNKTPEHLRDTRTQEPEEKTGTESIPGTDEKGGDWESKLTPPPAALAAVDEFRHRHATARSTPLPAFTTTTATALMTGTSERGRAGQEQEEDEGQRSGRARKYAQVKAHLTREVLEPKENGGRPRLVVCASGGLHP